MSEERDLHHDRCQRRYPRFAFVKDVCLRAGGELQFGRLTNIGPGGAFVETRVPLEVASSVGLQLTIPGIAESCELECSVRWIDRRGGVGLAFERLRPAERDGLQLLERWYGRPPICR